MKRWPPLLPTDDVSNMNPSEPSNATNGQQPAGGINVIDVCYTLFRHKWLILGFVCLGVVGALVVRIKRPPIFVSRAELMVHYIADLRAAGTANQEGRIVSPEPAGLNIINSELEILKSLDVATNVAAKFGPAKLLARKGGGDDLMSAAGVLSSGIETENPARTTIIAISFKHPDSKVVQPVLYALIDAYKLKHNQVHGIGGDLDAYYIRQSEELREKLAKTEEDLKQIQITNKLVSVEDAKRVYQTQIAKWRDELLTAERELAMRQATAGNEASAAMAGGTTNVTEVSPSLEKISDYNFAISQLENLKRIERELLLKYTKAYPTVQTVQSQIEKFSRQKSDLEKEFPALGRLGLGIGQSGTNSPLIGIAAELADIRRLTAGVTYIQKLLTNLQAEASRVMEIEPTINGLLRQRDLESTNYLRLSTLLHEARVSQSLGPGNMINMSTVQYPTPPERDTKKLKKLLMTVFGGCTAGGLALAFLIDFVLFRTIRRSADIERHLHLPVFLSIPDTNWKAGLRLPWLNGKRSEKIKLSADNTASRETEDQCGLAPWDPSQQLRIYTEGLRERLMAHFEIQNMNQKKPKLVGVTACAKGAGVTALASGLAAALSKTGEGNVLLVDMNTEQGVAHSFFDGQPGCGLEDALETGSRAEAQVKDNLYLAAIGEENSNKLANVLPTRFTQILPKLRASEYDYIIFDMPAVSPMSATPRLASYMDIVLLVLEAEKTGQQLATRATARMRESRANLGAVLNKYRRHVPALLSQES